MAPLLFNCGGEGQGDGDQLSLGDQLESRHTERPLGTRLGEEVSVPESVENYHHKDPQTYIKRVFTSIEGVLLDF